MTHQLLPFQNLAWKGHPCEIEKVRGDSVSSVKSDSFISQVQAEPKTWLNPTVFELVSASLVSRSYVSCAMYKANTVYNPPSRQ